MDKLELYKRMDECNFAFEKMRKDNQRLHRTNFELNKLKAKQEKELSNTEIELRQNEKEIDSITINNINNAKIYLDENLMNCIIKECKIKKTSYENVNKLEDLKKNIITGTSQDDSAYSSYVEFIKYSTKILRDTENKTKKKEHSKLKEFTSRFFSLIDILQDEFGEGDEK